MKENAIYNFEKLEVWQMAMEFAKDIYKVTSSFPGAERFGLTSQLKRASVSIASNIAEGAGRHHEQDFIRFLRIALGSTYETVTELFIAKNESYVNSKDFQNLYEKSISVSKLINGLITALQKKARRVSK